MRISIEFEGLAELQRKFELLASEAQIRETNKIIFQRCADLTQPRMQEKMPRSADNSKSGKKGYRPSGHAKDNVPKKATASYGEAGWPSLGDAEDWFYMKFVEWGTSRQPPRDFIFSVREESAGDYAEIAEEEYQKVLSRILGGN